MPYASLPASGLLRDFCAKVLGLREGHCDESLGWVQFDLDGVFIGLERCEAGDPDSSDLVGRFVGVSLAVEDVSSTYQLLCDRGVEFVGPPEQQPWGGVLAHFYDLDRNVLTLLGEMRGT